MDTFQGIAKSDSGGSEKIKIAYIGGCARSGSTLLLRLLGQADGLVAVGELDEIWSKCFLQNQLCGCGKPFRSCEFWEAVVQEAFGGFQQVNPEAVLALKRRVESDYGLPALIWPALRTSSYCARLEAYLALLQQLYSAIQTVSGCSCIVDSSKGPRYAFTLSRVHTIDLRIVHLIRDSRATAYSWQRKKVQPDIYWQQAYMERIGPTRVVADWDIVHSLFELLKLTGARVHALRYEDLVQEPQQMLFEVQKYLDIATSTDGFIDATADEKIMRFGVNHTAAGNPNRFMQGEVSLHYDAEWQTHMMRRDWLQVTALSWPLLSRYGYKIKGGYKYS